MARLLFDTRAYEEDLDLLGEELNRVNDCMWGASLLVLPAVCKSHDIAARIVDNEITNLRGVHVYPDFNGFIDAVFPLSDGFTLMEEEGDIWFYGWHRGGLISACIRACDSDVFDDGMNETDFISSERMGDRFGMNWGW